MAFSRHHFCSSFSLIVLLISAFAPAARADRLLGSFPAIFAFGDSLSDTGNGVLSGNPLALRTSQLPYGETFPGWPARRFSDGHVLLDLLALHLDLPMLNPYLNNSSDFENGVNYAVGSAAALNVSLLASLGIYPCTNLSLGMQLSWHLELQAEVQAADGHIAGRPSVSSFSEGLYFIGIGGNDYIYSYLASYSTSFVISTVMPMVIQEIHNTVEALLSSGAQHFVLMSITPLGCSPSILSVHNGTKDASGCLEEYNYASYLHSARLQEEVDRLRASYPHATFALMDLYGVYAYVLKQHELFGFSETLKVCCGAGSNYPYNFSSDEECCIDSNFVCENPSEYIQWDGVHHTDSFHLQIFNQTFLMGSYLNVDFATFL